MGIKDFCDTAGLQTTAAFERFRDRNPQKNAVSIEMLKRAGAAGVHLANDPRASEHALLEQSYRKLGED